MRRRLVLLGVLVCVCILNVSVQATILTFEDLGIENYDCIPAAYGNHVGSLYDAIGSYWKGYMFTPNISVKYRTLSPDGGTILTSILFWGADYGDLFEVGFPAIDGNLAEVSLVADPGYEVILDNFVLGGWPRTNQLNQTVRILDKDYNVLIDYSPVDIKGDNGHSVFTPRIRSEVIRIQYGPSWNTGIDNINFNQAVDTVPPDQPGGGFYNLLNIKRK